MAVIVVGALGRGIGSESPLAQVVETYDAKKVYVVVTKESLTRMKDFAAYLGTKYERIEVIPVVISSADDPITTLEEIERICPFADIVDITAGTKAMAAALFAFAMKIGAKVTYVTGARDVTTGRVISGTEEVQEFDIASVAERICHDKRDR